MIPLRHGPKRTVRSAALLIGRDRLIAACAVLLCLLPLALSVVHTPNSIHAAHSAVPPSDTTTDTPTITSTASPTSTATPTLTFTVTASTTNTVTATMTALPTTTSTGTSTPTNSRTNTPTNSPSVTATVAVIPVVAVNPTIVIAGSHVAVNGSSFLPGEPVQVQLTTTSSPPSSVILGSATADAFGAFSAPSLTIPAGVAAGAYKIIALGLTSSRSAQAFLQINAPTPTLSVNPTSFSVGGSIQVSGANFLANETVNVSLSAISGSVSTTLGTLKANSSGGFGPSTLHVPFGVSAGNLVVVATGQTSNRQATTNVIVQATTPTINVTPTSGKPGDALTVSGTHFQPGETLTLDLVTLANTARLATTRVNSSGVFTVKNVKIPANTPQGTASLVASGATSHLSATTQLTIGALPATLIVSPGRVVAGRSINLSGSGFIPGETVSLSISGAALQSLSLATVIVGTSGAFSVTHVTIPSFVPSGSFTLTASGQSSGRSATTGLVVQAPSSAAPILGLANIAHLPGTPYDVSPGSVMQVAGSNFPANTNVEFALAGPFSFVTLGAASSTSTGALGPLGITLPANTAAGSYTLQALVAGSKVASVALRVATLQPHLTVSTLNLTPGVKVGVQGSGFAPGEQVVLALNGAALVTLPTTVLANAVGAFSSSFIVPSTVNNGTNVLTASGVSSRAGASVNLQAALKVSTRWYFAYGDTTAGHHTTISLLNPTGIEAAVTMIFLYQAEPERHYSLVAPAHAHIAVDLALEAGVGRHVSVIVEANRQIGAESVVSIAGGDTSTALGAGAPTTTWYLAEGYTGGSFHEFVEIMNPNISFATVDVRFVPFNGKPPKDVRFSVLPRSNIVIDAGQYMPAQSISTIVTANKGIVVERTMHFGLKGRGSHDKVGIATASTIWLFAQADTGPLRQTFLTILNPNSATAAAVTATLFNGKGTPIGARTIVVNPLRRGNIKINDILPFGTPGSTQVAVAVTSTVPVVVERSQYEGPADLGQARSGSDIFGRNGGAPTWVFPGGSTANGNLARIFLFNPGLKTAQVTATFYTDSGAQVQQYLTLPANSQSVLNANVVPGLSFGPFGAVIASSNGVAFVAEQWTLNTVLEQSSVTQGIAQGSG